MFLENMGEIYRRRLNGDSKNRGEDKDGNSLGEVHVASVVNDLDAQRNARGVVLDGLRKVESDNVRIGVKVKVRIGEREVKKERERKKESRQIFQLLFDLGMILD